jgi:hypothetical protein
VRGPIETFPRAANGVLGQVTVELNRLQSFQVMHAFLPKFWSQFRITIIENLCKTLDFHGGDYEEFRLVGRSTV